MKKIIALLLSLCCVCILTACESVVTVFTKYQVKECVVSTHYDYGFHQEERAVLLYNSCTDFFTLPEGMAYAIAGDVFTLAYTGEMMIQTSYPGSVIIEDGEIRSVKVEKAKIMQLIYRQDGWYASSGEAVLILELPEYVIENPQSGAFVPLTDIEEGTLLYASYSPVDGYDEENGYRIAALFTVNPR